MTTKTKTSTLGKFYRVLPGYALHMGDNLPSEHRIWATAGKVVCISHELFENLLAMQAHKVEEVTDKALIAKAVKTTAWQDMRCAELDGKKKPSVEESVARSSKEDPNDLPSLKAPLSPSGKRATKDRT